MAGNDTSKEYDDCVDQKNNENMKPATFDTRELEVIDEENIKRDWNDPEKQWLAGGMPEMDSSRPEKPYHQVYLRFENEENMQKFAKLINQNINTNTKSVWYPMQGRETNIMNQWVEED
jgi:hypothetical protein